MPVLGRSFRRRAAPGTPVLSGPLEDVQVPVLCSTFASIAPGTTFLPGPLQDGEMTASGSEGARLAVPRTSALPGPLHDVQTPCLGV